MKEIFDTILAEVYANPQNVTMNAHRSGSHDYLITVKLLKVAVDATDLGFLSWGTENPAINVDGVWLEGIKRSDRLKLQSAMEEAYRNNKRNIYASSINSIIERFKSF